MIPFTLISVTGSLAAASSAIYGYTEVSKCRNGHDPYSRYQRWEGNDDDYDEDYED